MNGRRVEYAGTPSGSALLSLAKWANVSLSEATTYAARGAISELIAEVRGGGRAETRVTPAVAYGVLRRRQELFLRMLRSFGGA